MAFILVDYVYITSTGPIIISWSPTTAKSLIRHCISANISVEPRLRSTISSESRLSSILTNVPRMTGYVSICN